MTKSEKEKEYFLFNISDLKQTTTSKSQHLTPLEWELILLCLLQMQSMHYVPMLCVLMFTPNKDNQDSRSLQEDSMAEEIVKMK